MTLKQVLPAFCTTYLAAALYINKSLLIRIKPTALQTVLGAKSLGRGLSLTRLVGHDDDDDDETVHIDLDCE